MPQVLKNTETCSDFEPVYLVRNVQSPPNSTRQDVTIVTEDGTGCVETKHVLLRAFWPEDLVEQQLLEQEAYTALCIADETSRAAIKGAELLQLRDHAKNGLREKLCRRGFSMQAAQDAVSYLEARGILREQDLLVRMMQYACDVKHWGPTKIRAYLSSKGFDLHAHWETYEDMLQQLDFVTACRKQVERIGLTGFHTPKERQKHTAALLRQGFYLTHIRTAIEELQQMTEQQCERE